MKLDQYLELNKNSKADFHTHTNYCDGAAGANEMAAAAFGKGLKAYGFSGHGYTYYDESYCMLPDEEAAYEKEVRALAAEYEGRMEILCGVEQDCLAGKPSREWDYVIGSVHYIDISEQIAAASAGTEGEAQAPAARLPAWLSAYPKGIVPIDESREIWEDIAERFFGGDVYAMIEKYYETEAIVYEKTGADVIGHFDLITKYNAGGEGGRQGALFDEGHPRYIAAWQKAADKLIDAGMTFEINTGGMSRGYRTDTYPAWPIREYIAARGGSFILSSDSHNTETLCSRFDTYKEFIL